MLRDRLIAALVGELPLVSFVFGTAPDPVATVRSPTPEVGTLTIYDDGDEATVDISEISHSHFNRYGESLSDDERHQSITEDVVDFLRALFADQVLLFRTSNRRTGGWQRLDLTPVVSDRQPHYQYFFWSGPA